MSNSQSPLDGNDDDGSDLDAEKPASLTKMTTAVAPAFLSTSGEAGRQILQLGRGSYPRERPTGTLSATLRVAIRLRPRGAVGDRYKPGGPVWRVPSLVSPRRFLRGVG